MSAEGMCTAGNYRNETDNKCYPCAVGKYQPQDLQDECLSCNKDYSTSGTGTVNATGCIFFCPDGHELKTPGTTTCTPCPRGKYRSNTDLLRFKACQECADSTKSTDDLGSKLPSDCKITSHVVLPEAFIEVVVGALLVIALAICCYCARRYIVKRKKRREERDQPSSHNARGVAPGKQHTRHQQTSRDRSQREHNSWSSPSQSHPDDRDWRRDPPTPCRLPATSRSSNQSEPSVVSHDYSAFTSTRGTDEHVYEHIYETISL